MCSCSVSTVRDRRGAAGAQAANTFTSESECSWRSAGAPLDKPDSAVDERCVAGAAAACPCTGSRSLFTGLSEGAGRAAFKLGAGSTLRSCLAPGRWSSVGTGA